ncbi:hypothetical protein MJO29_014597 [Puccinia striiformis f. sp. tritici]|nr:hypothetical protein MJO29_014597 [Puccinia striiformis f. sp. tritici]
MSATYSSSDSGESSHPPQVPNKRRNLFDLNLNLKHQHQQAASQSVAILRKFIIRPLLFMLHLVYHFNHYYLSKPKLIPISASTTPINSALPASISHLTRSSKLPNDNHQSAILLTNNSEINPLSLDLALDFATIGYHVFIQVSSHSQLSEVIVRWQRLKSKLIKQHHHNPTPTRRPRASKQQPSSSILNSICHQLFTPASNRNQAQQLIRPRIGTIIPLLYFTHDVAQRLEAISTISAYLHENAIDMISLLNIIDPSRIRKSCPNPFNSPTSPTFSLSRSNQTPLSASSSPSITCRPLTGNPSPPASSDFLPSLHSPSILRSLPTGSSIAPLNHELHNPEPLPLSISAENYLFDAYGDTLIGPLSTTQDLLLLLKDHRGRVINIWDGPQHSPSALTNILLDGFRKINNVLKTELETLNIPVSIIYKPPGDNLNVSRRSAQSTVTRDPRSLLTEASDPDLLNIFIKQTAEVMAKESSTYKASSNPRQNPSFDLIKSVLETNYPCPVYPIGIRELVDQVSQLSGLGRMASALDRLLEI